MNSRLSGIIIAILIITNVICLVQCSNTSSQVDDCVSEIDDFKSYYDAVESVLDRIDADSADLLDTYFETDEGSKYLTTRKRLERTWAQNHDTKLNEYVVTEHER